MCGIAGFHIRAMNRTAFDPSKFAAELLMAVDHRGGDATGYVAFTDDGVVQMQKAACNARTFLTGARSLPKNTRTALLHTRLATQGKAAFPENNHPVVHGPIYAVHNGQIWNDGALFHRLGLTRMGYVDSEIIPALIADVGWSDIAAALEELDGSYALALANEHEPNEVVLARGDYSPLVYLASDHIIAWASESNALLTAWRKAIGTPPPASKIVTMKSGELVKIADGKIERSTFQAIDQFVPATSSYSLVNDRIALPALAYLPRKYSKVGTISPKLETALQILDERAKGTVKVWDGRLLRDYDSAKSDPETTYVRCGCCDDYTESIVMDELFGEFVCPECYEIMTEDMVMSR